MKKYVIGIIATMALLTVGCSDDSSEQLTDVTSSTPMTFAVDEEALTRLDYINSVRDLQEFTIVAQVDGKVYKQGNFKYDASSKTIIHAQGETWLWPGDDTAEVTFYATNNIDWREIGGIDTSEPIVGDERTFTNELGTNDMVCAYKKVKRTDCPDGIVPLNFNHALAELGILVRGEFPAGMAVSYRIIIVEIKGEYEQYYNFKSNTWNIIPDWDKSNNPYYINEDGFLLGDTNGTYVELLDSEMQPVGDTFRFLQPGDYEITINYCQDNDEKYKTTKEVTLKQGQKNRILLTLPYEPPA